MALAELSVSQGDSVEAPRWGRRYLMCPPDHFDVSYAINPWMDAEATVDRDVARSQWESLVATLRLAGAVVELLEPVDGLPDMVFTANHGIVDASGGSRGARGGTTRSRADERSEKRSAPGASIAATSSANEAKRVPTRQQRPLAGVEGGGAPWGKGVVHLARMRHPERAAEVDHAACRLRELGFLPAPLPAGALQEGLGDALPFGDVVLAGHGVRSNRAAIVELTRRIAAPVVPLGLHDPRWYHVDLTFCPLDDRRALVFPDAWDATGRRAVAELVPQPLVLDADEAATFAANSVVIDRTVVMPAVPPRVGRELEGWGFDVVAVDVGEFRKAGGAVRCLTLALDTVLATSPPELLRRAAGAPRPPAGLSPRWKRSSTEVAA